MAMKSFTVPMLAACAGCSERPCPFFSTKGTPRSVQRTRNASVIFRTSVLMVYNLPVVGILPPSVIAASRRTPSASRRVAGVPRLAWSAIHTIIPSSALPSMGSPVPR